MNKYTFTAVRYYVDAQLLHIARHKMYQKLSVAYQYTALYSLFQIAICYLWRQTPLIKAFFHPASNIHMHSRLLTVRRTDKVKSS